MIRNIFVQVCNQVTPEKWIFAQAGIKRAAASAASSWVEDKHEMHERSGGSSTS